MKKWVPDYSNMSSTNLISGNQMTVTISDTGFICVGLITYGNNDECSLSINGNKMMSGTAGTSGYGQASGVLPITSGDVITLDYDTDVPHFMHFIPGKWV